MKTENKTPLAIIIVGLIVGLIIAASIYVSSTFEYRKALAGCEYRMLPKGFTKELQEQKPLFQKVILPECAFRMMNNLDTITVRDW